MKPPHVLLALSELPRALADATLLQPAIPLLRRLPRGAGQAVMVLPGFMGSDRGNQPLIRFLNSMGYNAMGWGQGQNRGQQNFSEDGLRERMTRMMQESKGKITLVGHSLGGLYAREIAKQQPDVIEQVITLGSPFAGDPRATNVSRIRGFFSKERAIDWAGFERRKKAPPVPTTAIHSRSDGVVNWRCSLEEPSPTAENVRVRGSHMGLTVNRKVLVVIADRLARRAAYR